MRHNKFKSGIYAGLVAGFLFLALEMLMVSLILGGNAFEWLHMIAAVATGKDTLLPGGFTVTETLAAAGVHLGLSVLYAFLIGLAVANLNKGWSIVGGVVAGLIIYGINFYGLTSVFPWLKTARNWVTVVNHIIFGVVASQQFLRMYWGIVDIAENI